jgi:hypothetical protein
MRHRTRDRPLVLRHCRRARHVAARKVLGQRALYDLVQQEIRNHDA